MTGRIEAAVSWVRTVTAAVIAALASILMDAIKNSVKSQLVAVLLMVLGAVRVMLCSLNSVQTGY